MPVGLMRVVFKKKKTAFVWFSQRNTALSPVIPTPPFYLFPLSVQSSSHTVAFQQKHMFTQII